MNAEEPQPDEGSILTRLVACDEALAEGKQPQEPPPGPTPVELRPRLEGDLACIQVLRKVLPRRSTSATPVSPAIDGAPVPAADLPFQELGRFRIRRRLGQGAFGMVFLASDPQLGRDVALKVPRPEALMTSELRERFLREARAAAGLDHPNLVAVYEAGAVGPLCYIASAYCPGVTLSEWLKERAELPPEHLAADLVATLADAVGHAHSRGVVHRDLKPSNILLQGKRRDPADGNSTVKEPSAGQNPAVSCSEFVPRITDFGLAKLIEDGTELRGDAVGVETRTGAVLGTPNYMAPEQASGKNKQIGPAADVYALGVILYELLTGRPPFRGESLLETLEQVRSREPPPPSRLRAKLSRDLETICLKCLQKEPHKRYESASDLADDLRRYLAGEPIQARPIRALERGIKWARRRPAPAALLIASILVPLVVAGISLAYNAELTDRNGKLKDALEAKEEKRRLAEEREWDARNFSYVSDMNLAQHDWASARVERLRELLQRHLPSPGAEDVRGFEWYYWKRLLYHSARRTLSGHVGEVWCVACSPDGKLLASGDKSGTVDKKGTVRLWDAVSGDDSGVLGTLQSRVMAVVFAEGGRTVAAGSLTGTICLFDVKGRKLSRTLTERGSTVLGLAAASGRSLLAIARAGSRGENGRVEIWDLEKNAPRYTLREHNGRVWAVAFSADGRMVASGDDDGILRLWDADTGKLLASYPSHQKVIKGVAFSPDGKQLAAACDDGTIRLWDWRAKTERILLGHTKEVRSVQFAPDGKTLVSASDDTTLRVWDANGGALFALKGHTAAVRGAVFTPDGRTIVSASEDHYLKLWDARRNPEYFRWQGHNQGVKHMAFTRDGSVMATGAQDGSVKFWEPATGRLLTALPLYPQPIRCLAFAPDGKLLAVACLDPFVHICDRQTAKEVVRLAGQTSVAAVAFSPDDKMLASGDTDGIVRIWDWRAQKTITVCTDHNQGIQGLPSSIQGLAFSPDGKLLASGGYDREIKLWEPSTGRLLKPLRGHEKTVTAVVFSPDGRTLASSSDDRTVRLWDIDSGSLRNVLGGHVGAVHSVAFSPDGRTLSSTSYEMKLWQTTTGRELATFTEPGDVCYADWVPRGPMLVGGSANGGITFWDARWEAP